MILYWNTENGRWGLVSLRGFHDVLYIIINTFNKLVYTMPA